MQLTQSDANFFLLAHLFRAPDIAETAFTTLEAEHFKGGDKPAHPVQPLIFHVCQSVWQKFDKTMPDDAVLDVMMHGAIALYRGELAEQLNEGYARFKQIRSTIGDSSEALARAVLRDLTDRFVFKPAIRLATEEALAGDNIAGVARRIADIEARRSGITGQRVETNVLSKLIEDTGDRLATSIPWLDARLGNGRGPVIGCLLIILAPQATGKTSLGIQLAVNQALQGNDALLVLAEEGLTKPMQRRIVSCVTGCPTKYLEQHDLKTALEQAQVDNMTAVKKIALAEEHLHVYDMIANPGGLDDVVSEIRNAKRRHPNLTYVYVDWAGPIARRMEQMPRKGTPHTMQTALKELADTLARVAAELNINVVTSHQLAPAKVQKGPYAEPSQYDAAECKGFTEMAKYAFVINPKTEDGVSICSITKSRDDVPPDKFVLRLRGEISTFVEVTEQFEWRGKKIRMKTTGNGRAVPKEEKPVPKWETEDAFNA